MATSSYLSIILFLTAAASVAGATKFGLEIHHRFSDTVRRWAESNDHAGARWPEHGTAEYYAALHHQDRALHSRRSLASAGDELAFLDGNATYYYSSLGYLHYAVVSIGTPNVSFLVALDTGSDLFWVPCECQQCAPLTSPSYQGLTFTEYSPNNSSTSQTVSCKSKVCSTQSTCSRSGSCTYNVQYLSDNTSTSGVLVEDVLYFTNESAQSQIVQAPVVFGCGQVQTGLFLDGGAPNGLMGLGMSNISVPSTLAYQGFVGNSFSMCFGSDGIGRINFGDAGSSDQDETPLNLDGQSSLYTINLTGIKVGNTSINSSFSAIVDSGTSFAYLTDPMYTQITSNFNSQVQQTRSASNFSSPFEYCYNLSPTDTNLNLPNISLITSSGSSFVVNYPTFNIANRRGPVGYCLAILNSSDGNIIGQNFMTGLRIVFDRERLVLGWQNYNCYSVDNSTTLPVNSHSSLGNTTESQILNPSSGHPSHPSATSAFALLPAALLFLAIL